MNTNGQPKYITPLNETDYIFTSNGVHHLNVHFEGDRVGTVWVASSRNKEALTEHWTTKYGGQ